jgi:hypothetical protein
MALPRPFPDAPNIPREGAKGTVSDFVLADPRKTVKKHEKSAKTGHCFMAD